MQKDEVSLFDGVDTGVTSLSRYVSERVPKDLADGLNAVAVSASTAQQAFESGNDAATVKPLLDGLFAVRVLRRELRTMSIDDAGKFEIDFRLRQKEGEFQQAALLANGLRVEALADDGVVVPGQPVKVNVIVANRGTGDVTVKQVRFQGFAADASTSGEACAMTAFTGGGFGFPGGGRGGRGRGGATAAAPQAMSTVRPGQVVHCEPTFTIPATARITEPYWHRQGEAGRYTFDADAPFGLPMRPTPFSVQVTLAMPGGEEVIDGLPVQHRYEGDLFSGEKRTELLVVPALSVRMSPQIAIIPAASIRSRPASPEQGRGARPGQDRAATHPSSAPPSADREIRVTVVNDTVGPADTTLRLEVPPGWTATPASQAIAFERGDESRTVRFDVRPAATAMNGEFHVRAIASSNGQTFDRGYEVIEYPHIRRYHIYDSAAATLKVIDVRTPANLRIGYVMGVGDQVPPAIEQLGATVEMISPDDLAWGTLSRFDAIVTGVRAYERREDLRANNRRLLDYVSNGGTLIVQYNKFEFNDAQYGPYPAKVSANRITNENAMPRVKTPSPLLTRPNEIGEAAWQNWVQERGLYFLAADKDARYHDVLEFDDNFTFNQGPKSGALVETTYGKGHWVYVGLGLWRQLPSGTDGAYQLLANLISLGKR